MSVHPFVCLSVRAAAYIQTDSPGGDIVAACTRSNTLVRPEIVIPVYVDRRTVKKVKYLVFPVHTLYRIMQFSSIQFENLMPGIQECT